MLPSDEEEMDYSMAKAHLDCHLPFLNGAIWGDFMKVAYEDQYKLYQVLLLVCISVCARMPT